MRLCLCLCGWTKSLGVCVCGNKCRLAPSVLVLVLLWIHHHWEVSLAARRQDRKSVTMLE
jgi:hypothetical protein